MEKKNIKGFFGQSSCAPLIGVQYSFGKDGNNRERIKRCERFNDNIYEFVKKQNIKSNYYFKLGKPYSEPVLNIKSYKKNNKLSDQKKEF